MIPTLQQFMRALLTPDLSLRTLTDARPVTEPNGLPRLMRTTRFAEATICWRERRWLLSMPLTASALPRIERTVSAIKRLTSEWIVPYRILPGELLWQDPSGEPQRCDLVLQLLPEGRDFEDALLFEDKSTLLDALDALQAELKRLAFTHNNLTAENLRWSAGRLIPLRYHDARIGTDSDGDAAEFETLRRKITQSAGPQQIVTDVEAPYDPIRSLTGHLWTSSIREGIVLVQDPSGLYGYVDPDNNPLIPVQYKWAGDFHENRAEVETETGAGLIDREGRYIIEPRYEMIEYDYEKSVVHVRLDGRWALFDYMGRRLTEFVERNTAVGSEIC
ncbi:WG repeat-containing protein [Alistipes sp.]|uniref:WG repeat-containing protein n=1 Tax=Alistipes sp. TaxID=1872444 RepID=UPI003AF04F04